jgi:hypothetical protein
MGESNQLFEDKCQIYWKWIMKLVSKRLAKPVYFIWINDKTDDGNTKMILNKSQRIVGAYDYRLLYAYLEDHKRDIPDPVNTFTWLNEVRDFKEIAVTAYHADRIEDALDTKSFTKAIMYECLNFINLFTDLADQVNDDSLFELSDSRQVRDLWKFVSYEIFWKEWGHEELPAVKIPPFETNFTLLNKRMKLLIQTFIDRVDMLDQKKSHTVPRNESTRQVLRKRRKRH